MNLIATSVIVLLVISSTIIPDISAEHPAVSRLRKLTPARDEDQPAHKRIRLGTKLVKPDHHQHRRHHYSPHIHPSPHHRSDGRAIIPVVNFSSMDGILLNLLMRRLSS